MEHPTSSNPSPKAGAGATGLAILIFVILVLVLATLIGINFLPNPYYVIGQGVIIAGVVAGCAAKLRNCFRLAKTSGESAQLHQVAWWGFVGVLFAPGLLVELSTAEKRPYTIVFVVIAFLLALLGALQLAENLLKARADTNAPVVGGAREEAKTPPNQQLQETGPA